ncbi:MAG: M14 family metallopeptidase [Gammaproteobacteria bacterium]
MRLVQLDTLPNGILEAASGALHELLPEPTLVHLPGKNPQPIFVSVLLHGNEPTGLMALQLLLKKYSQQSLPRSLSIFFGNTLAAKQGLRRLDGQPDFNRIWPGTELEQTPESRVMAEIFESMKDRNVFASIDVHNNTGLNPHYACVNKLDHRFLQLARLFGRLVVHFIRPKGVQTSAFAEICPAVTLECGRPGQQYGVEHAFEFIDSCLHLSEISDHPVPEQDIDLFHTVAQITVRDDIQFSFQNENADLLLNEDLERMNFTEIPAGTVLGKITDDTKMPIIAKDEYGNDMTPFFFSVNNHDLKINRESMPSMLTLDERVIRQDCLCYLMERLQR